MQSILYFSLAILFSPMLIIQGLYTRYKARGLPEATGPRRGTAGEGEKLSILILGDSAGAGVGVEKQTEALSGQLVANLSKYYQIHWQLFAHSGDTSLASLKRLMVLDKTSMEKVDYVLVSLGVNDVTSRVSIKNWLEQCEGLIEVLNKYFTPERIYWSELPPMGKFVAIPQPLRWVVGQRRNQLAAALRQWLAGQKNAELLDFPDIFADKTRQIENWLATDGFHPGKKMYALWGKIAAERIITDNQSS